ncbi:MAG: hypothetical protein LBG59_02920 [Candidatus Peribacteria bacterium]|jgi:hypothetical protein|nr:hypothetical protein [Candidatus Peribacteria bacterium]
MAFPSPDRLPQYKDNLPSKNEHIEKLPEGETKRLLQLLWQQTSAKAATDKEKNTDSTMEKDFSSLYETFFQSEAYTTFTPSSTQTILQCFVKWTGDNKVSLSQSLSSTNKELTLATFRNIIYALINQIKAEEAKRFEELGIPRETAELKNEILEQSKRKFEKLLEVNGQPFEVEHIHLVKSTSAGNEYIVVGKMKGSGGEFDEKITSLPTAFHIKESHKTDGTVVVVSLDRMPNFGHSQRTRSIEKNHLLLNGLMAFEIKGIPSKEVKKVNTSITYDKAKTKEKIHEHLRQKQFSCTPEGVNVDNLPLPMQHLKTKLSTILQDAFLLDKQVETQDDQLDTHTRDLIIKDDQ